MRETSRAGAWASLQTKLSGYADVLVPTVVSLKDFLSIFIDIEVFLKTEQGSESMHPMEALAKFLNTPTTPTRSSESEVEVIN